MQVDPLGNQLYIWVAQFIFGQDSLVRAYNLDPAFIARSLRGTISDPYMRDMAISPDGRFLYTAHSTGVWSYNLATLALIGELPLPGGVSSLATDYRGEHLYAGVGVQVLEIDLNSGAVLATLDVGSRVDDILVSASGRTLIVHTAVYHPTTGRVTALDLITRQQRWTLVSDAEIGMLALFP
jgi:DNA-binding beta-propeller fold protein YncE